jgi:hypothetical protein
MSLNTPGVALCHAGPAACAAVSSLLGANWLPLEGTRASLLNYVIALSNGEVVGTPGAPLPGNVNASCSG